MKFGYQFTYITKKRVFRKGYFLLILFFCFHYLAFSQLQSNSFQFLNVPKNARNGALNNIPNSLNDSSIFDVSNNPALLSNSLKSNISMNYLKYVADIHAGYLSYVFNTKKYGTWMSSVQYMSYGKITETNEFGDKIREFSTSDLSANLSYSTSLFKHFKYGVQTKFIYSQLLYNNSFAISTDHAIHYSKNPKMWGYTLSVNDLGMSFYNYTKNQTNFAPLNIQVAGSFKLTHAPLRVHILYKYLNHWDLIYITDSTTLKRDPFTNEVIKNSFTADNFFRHTVLGVDFMPSSKFYLTMSYDHKRRKELQSVYASKLAGFAFGFGLNLKKIQINYALYGNGSGLSSNFISLATNLSQFSKK